MYISIYLSLSLYIHIYICPATQPYAMLRHAAPYHVASRRARNAFLRTAARTPVLTTANTKCRDKQLSRNTMPFVSHRIASHRIVSYHII